MTTALQTRARGQEGAMVPAIGMVDTTTIAQPTDSEVIRAIRRATGRNEAGSKELYNWVREAVEKYRKYGCFHLTNKDLANYHDDFTTVIPPNQPSTPGSVHDLIERALLDKNRGEVSLRHGVTNGVVKRCSVTIEIVTPS